MKPTQIDHVKAALINREIVNSVVMFDLNITRLSSIIKRLRDKGYPIVTRCDNNNGLANYSLPEGYKEGGDIDSRCSSATNECPFEFTPETSPPISAYIPMMKN
ncbi:MAG: hypothetical protein WCP96_18735 [Methylococcaceae bacterium]